MTYNTSNVKSYLLGCTASDLSNFASDISTLGLQTAFTNRFTMTTNQATDLGLVPTHMVNCFSQGLLHAAVGVANGYVLDVSGVDISDVSSGNNYTSGIKITADVIIVYTGGLPAFTVSYVIIHVDK